ncbi:MAG: DNA polymerase III subunit gamma/tau [Nostocaceae cyanobacterium]|nr:DNA polymerase III subunit gamma/tau [Nostocaceae cyanobacterium]
MSYEPLHHKYRPKSFSQLVGQEAIATTLTNAIDTTKIAPAYLFTGPRGTGKTSSARILAKSLNCLSSKQPTAEPCGVCDVCQGISNGSTLDVIEIDAASNTGVDNIREIIERAQFAPVQCRYKVYVVDECLTGDSLVLTSEGHLRIDDPSIKGKQVLSYNDSTGEWEYKKVLRWLERGERQTLVIKTTNREIRCTGNHLIRTDRGWIPARDVKEGVKILSPANVDAAPSFTNSALMDVPEGLLADTSSKAIPTGKNLTIGKPSFNKRKHSVPSVLADVEKSWMSPPFYNKKAKALKASCLAGKNTLTRKDTVSGNIEQKNSSLRRNFSQHKPLGLSTAPYWEIVPSLTQTNTADSPDWLGLMEKISRNGWNIKPIACKHYDQNSDLHLTRDTGINQLPATQPVTHNSQMCLTSLNPMEIGKLSLWTGSIELPQKDLLGGIWMMAPSVSALKEVHRFNYTQKDSLAKKTKSLLIGLQQWDILQLQSSIPEVAQARDTITYGWEQTAVENGWQTSNSTPSPQWITHLETVESVHLAGVQKVYDLEVEDNHNFVANGLTVHNCHMLSTAAFNALLKTLEEPPKHVVFVLATTDPQRVLPTIISRCQRFDFRRIPLEAMVEHLITIAQNENINITPEAVTLVAQLSQGGLRDAESLLDQLSLLRGDVTPDRVWDLVGSVSERDLLGLVRAIASNSGEATLDSTRYILDKGREPLTVLQNLAAFYRDLLIAKTAPSRGDLVACTQETWQVMCELVQPWDMSLILAAQQHLRSCEVQVKNTTQPRLWLEVTLLGLLPSAIAPPVVVSPIQSSPPAVGGETTAPRTETPPPTSYPQTPPLQPTYPAAERVSPAPTPIAQSSPTSPPPTPIPEPQPVDSNPNWDLPTIWQQVLTHIEPRSIREIMRQMCYLIEFDGNIARLGIKGKWKERVQTELPKITSAFQTIFQRQVTVTLETANSSPPVSAKTLPPSPAPSQAQPNTPASGNYNPGNNRVSSYQHGNHSNLTTAPLPTKPESNNNQPRNNPLAKIETPKTVTQAVETAQPPQTATIKGDSCLDDEVAIASQRLAQFFDGEVVRFANEPSEISEPLNSSDLEYEAEID